MTCRLCTLRGKTWEGSDPQCAFVDKFEDNLNCATLNALRDAITGDDLFGRQTAGSEPMVYFRRVDDRSVAFVDLNSMGESRRPKVWLDDTLAHSLWMIWYKGRARVDETWLLGEGEDPRRPTEEECILIAEALGHPVGPPYPQGS